MQSNNGNGMFGALLLEAPHNSRESSWRMVYRNISWLMTGGLQQSVRGVVMTGLLSTHPGHPASDRRPELGFLWRARDQRTLPSRLPGLRCAASAVLAGP